MRVLWVDADENPWTDANGWRVLQDFGVQVQRFSTVTEAQVELSQKNFDLLLVRAELAGAPSLLVQARRILANDQRRILLVSSEWSREQFRTHSKTEGAAHRYASVPMPPEGLLNLFSDLYGCAVEELAELDLSVEPTPSPEEEALAEASPSHEAEASPSHEVEPAVEEVLPEAEAISEATPAPAATPAPRPRKGRKGYHEAAESGDLEVVRKYLAIREEQLDLSDGERVELANENERLRKEAQGLQMKLREFEHMHSELEKKLKQMEEDKTESEKTRLLNEEEAERSAKAQAERIKGFEAQIVEANEKYENLRSRVRKDIRKIKENERELEARLELNRKDSSTLLAARDEKVFEMQRKIDALEFDLDQVQDSRVQAQMEAERYLAKLSRVARALQIATSMIETDRTGDSELDELEPLAGGAANAEELKEPGAGAETPPAEGMAPEALSPELAALATEGEATQMIDPEAMQKLGGEPGSQN